MISPKRLADLLKHAPVLVVGDLMLDCYYWGDVRRISPEAPVPVVKVNQKSYQLGGAGNVAANLAGLGCPATIVGMIGQDEAASRIKTMISSLSVGDRCVVDADRPTTTKTRIMAGKQQVVRLDEEESAVPAAFVAERLLKSVKEELVIAKAVILSDYGKGLFVSPAWIQAIIQECREKKRPVFVDPKGRDWSRYKGATCITPNTAELALVLGETVEEEGRATPAIRDLCLELSLEKLLVTQGPRGMTLFQRDAPPFTIAAKAREVFDVSGAGDTVVAALAACVATGMPYDQAASVANTAAGIVVAKLGTQPVSWRALERSLENEGRRKPNSTLWKVAEADEAQRRLSGWRKGDQTIVFTNGCFDLLHPGHVSLLHQARSLGDRLIVGLNSDDSIQRLKGAQRPILPGEDRAAILSALEDVDMVVFFEEDTPLNLIRLLKPDILVKGEDYRIEEVVGKEIVEAYGGQVRLVKIVEGHSTTAIAGKLSEN